MAYKKKNEPAVDEQDERQKEESNKKKFALMIAARSICRKSYLKYVEITNTTMNEETDWKKGKHLVYLCDKVQEFIETKTGHAYDIMIISMPPQHGKSV